MAIIVKPFTFFPGTIIRSTEVNADFNTIYSDYNGNITNDNISATANILYSKLVTMTGDATITAGGVITVSGFSPAASATGTNGFVPIGSIIPFYDFGVIGNPPPGSRTFDTNYWRYCDGSVLAYGASPLNGQTLPDLSGRYLVGFGTDGGGDIDTAVWATAAVGNASHQINIQHSHTVNAHNHGMQNHTHAEAAHTHTFGTLTFQVAETVLGEFYMNNGGGAGLISGNETVSAGVGAIVADNWPAGSNSYYTYNGSGNTGSTSPGATGVPSNNTTTDASPGTDNQLSTTQSIQPRSIRVRYIMRVL